MSGGAIIRGSGSNIIRLHSYVDITGFTVLGGGAQTPSLLVDTVKSQNSSPYNDSIYLNTNPFNNPNRIEVPNDDFICTKNLLVMGSIFVPTFQSIKYNAGPIVGGYSLAQAISDATVAVTSLQNDIALININMGNFTITQFITFSNSIPTTYVAKS